MKKMISLLLVLGLLLVPMREGLAVGDPNQEMDGHRANIIARLLGNVVGIGFALGFIYYFGVRRHGN